MLPSLPDQQAHSSSRPDRLARAVGVGLLWTVQNVVPTLAALVTTYTLGWLYITDPTIRYTPNSGATSVVVTVRCESLADQLPDRYFYDDLNRAATAVEVTCAQQSTARAAWFGGFAPLTLLCWVWTFRRRDPRPAQARLVAARERLMGSVGPGGGQRARPASRPSRLLQYGLTGVVMGSWWANWQVANAHHWNPFAMCMLYIAGVVAVGALLAVVMWLERRPW